MGFASCLDFDGFFLCRKQHALSNLAHRKRGRKSGITEVWILLTLDDDVVLLR